VGVFEVLLLNLIFLRKKFYLHRNGALTRHCRSGGLVHWVRSTNHRSIVRKSALRTRLRPLSWPPKVGGRVHCAARMRTSGLTVFTPITSR
jgi:hypothetical protein